MIPGEVITKAGDIELNAGAAQVTIEVANTGDRPIQVGSHYHFYETNNGLRFDREKARGMRLDIAAGTQRVVVLDLDHQVGIGQAHAIASGRAEHFRVGAAGDRGHQAGPCTRPRKPKTLRSPA